MSAPQREESLLTKFLVLVMMAAVIWFVKEEFDRMDQDDSGPNTTLSVPFELEQPPR